MEQKQSLQQMVLGDLDNYMQKNETRSPTYTIHNNKFKVDKRPFQCFDLVLLIWVLQGDNCSEGCHCEDAVHGGWWAQLETYRTVFGYRIFLDLNYFTLKCGESGSLLNSQV